VNVRRAIGAAIVIPASLYVVFMAVVGYGFGQLFFGTFSLTGTICALSAVGSIVGVPMCGGARGCRLVLLLLITLAMVCFGLEVVDYYTTQHAPGNYFAWDMNGPFLLCLLIVFSANLYGYLHRPNTSLERTRER
jgi:hypothetical protein